MKLSGILTTMLMFILTCSIVVAQKQNNNWYFGNQAAINFGNTNPISISTNASLSIEGCASVSDERTGSMLFYTNGKSIWNANHVVMPNGNGILGGQSNSSTQGALIVSYPNNPSKYFVFTVDETNNNAANGFRYSIVDMNLDNGLGDVVNTQKNVLIQNNTTERLCLAKKSDDKGFWVMIHERNNNIFKAYEVTESGLNITPVISSSGLTHNALPQVNGDETMGCMKLNNNFNKLAVAIYSSNNIQVFDFDKCTGRTSNPITISTLDNPYGVEFSPDDSKLYYTLYYNAGFQGAVFQVNMQTADIPSSSVLVGISSSANNQCIGAMQLAPDNKIYIAINGESWLSAISNPNNLGTSCGFTDKAIILLQSGISPSPSYLGLPQKVLLLDNVSFIPKSITATNFCKADSTSFSVTGNQNFNNISWNFGDPSSGVNNTAVGLTVKHSYAQVGSYNVRAIVSTNCGFDTLFLNGLSIINCNNPSPTITGIKISGDTCDATASLSLQATGGVSSSPYFFWNFGDPASGVNDTITITGLSPSPFPNHTFSRLGTYNVCVSFQEPGQSVSTVCRSIKIGLCCDAIITSSDSCLENSIPFFLTTGGTINSVTWNFDDASSGSNNISTSLNPNHKFSRPGTYNVTVVINAICSTYTKTFTKRIVTCLAPVPCVGSILYFDSCVQSSINFQLSTSSTVSSVLWNFGDALSGSNNTSSSRSPSHTFSGTGTYTVTATATLNCGNGTSTFRKMVNIVSCGSSLHNTNCDVDIASAFSPNGDGINDFISPVTSKNCVLNDYEFIIFDRGGQIIFQTRSLNQKWDGRYKHRNCPFATYYYLLKYKLHNQQNINRKSGYIQLLR